MMKRILALLAALLLTVTSFAQSKESARLLFNLTAKVFEKALPMDMGDLLLTHFEVKGDDLVLTYLFKEETLSFDAYYQSMASDRIAMVRRLASSLMENKETVALLKASELNFKMVLIGKKCGRREEILVTYEELAGITEEDRLSPREYIEETVRSMQSSLPQPLGDNLVLTEAFVDNEWIVYKYQTTDQNISLMKMNQTLYGESAMQWSVLEQIKSNYTVMAMVKYLVKADMGFCYIYYSAPDRPTFTIRIPTDLLRPLVGEEADTITGPTSSDARFL